MTLDPVVSSAMASTSSPAMPAACDGVRDGGGQGRHVVGVALGGVVGIFLLAMQRIFGGARAEAALAADRRWKRGR